MQWAGCQLRQLVSAAASSHRARSVPRLLQSYGGKNSGGKAAKSNK